MPQRIHGELTGQQGNFLQYEINDLCLCQPGFHVPDISDSTRTVNKFVQVVQCTRTGKYQSSGAVVAGSFWLN